jgi:hypothetical protein
MWDVKGQVSAAKGEVENAQHCGGLAGTNLWQMRWSMRLAVFGILMVLVIPMWIHG